MSARPVLYVQWRLKCKQKPSGKLSLSLRDKGFVKLSLTIVQFLNGFWVYLAGVIGSRKIWRNGVRNDNQRIHDERMTVGVGAAGGDACCSSSNL
jgi:hypothetical protein